MKASHFFDTKIIGIMTLVNCLYYLYTAILFLVTYDVTQGYEPMTFGYPVTKEWGVVVMLFWSIFTIGAISMILNKKLGWLFLNPLLLITIIYVATGIYLMQVDAFYLNFIQLIIAVIFMVVLNRKHTLVKLKIYPKSLPYYLGAMAIVITMSCLFLIVGKH